HYMSLHGGKKEVHFISVDKPNNMCDILRTTRDLIIPANHEMCIAVKTTKFQNNTELIIKPTIDLTTKLHVAGGKCLGRVHNGTLIYKLLNPNAHPVTIPAGTAVAKAEQFCADTVIKVTDTNDTHDTHTSTGCSDNIPSVNTCDTHIDYTCMSEQDKLQYQQIALDLGFDFNESHLSEEQKSKLLTFLGKHRAVFAKDMSELGSTHLMEHTINTGNSKPVRTPPYRQSPTVRAEVDRQVREMQEHGVCRNMV
ncbi:MAG: hypothetical protein ABW168_17730, partial [Sedimenticola sp.]